MFYPVMDTICLIHESELLRKLCRAPIDVIINQNDNNIINLLELLSEKNMLSETQYREEDYLIKYFKG